MTNKEAIKWLEMYANRPVKWDDYSDGSKIIREEAERQIAEAFKMAINALKAQEPRVMTVSEIGTLTNGDVVWVEFTDGRLLPMMVEDGCLMRWRFIWRICEDAFYDEDYKARAWTSRPDQATREAIPWN